MASSNFSTVFSLALFLVLLIHANSASETSFNIKTFHEANLILQGNASVSSSGTLRLTNIEANKPTVGSVGRAFYSAPIQIWDRKTGNVASFDTSFRFNILAENNADISADGLAFALVPVGSELKGKGGLLGLFDDYENKKKACAVAVEFDTYVNDWDPKYRHIGIDVNSIESVKTTSWELVNGRNADVRVTYDSSTKILMASQIYPRDGTTYILSATVDLQSVLPEWVSVGFSATSGLNKGTSETHDVLSWSFSSKISDDNPSKGLNLPDIL